MQTYTFRLKPLSAFATEILGDTLFGQLCWAIRNHHGEAYLGKLLKGYTEGQPFMVVSDAFPSGHIPKPSVPSWFFNDANPELRKLLKKKVWMPLESIGLSLEQWQTACKSTAELLDASTESHWSKEGTQPHNTINRLSGTTGSGDFAPYTVGVTHYADQTIFDCHIVLDEVRFDVDSLGEVLQNIGHFGFGKDATIGAGKFEVVDCQSFSPPAVDNVNASLSLAPCAPQGLGYDAKLSFYQPFTRFGRHGDIAVHQSGKPFKSPVLMAKSGSIFGVTSQSGFIGQGLGAEKQKLSSVIPETVQQGYCPVVPVSVSRDIVNKLELLENDQ